MSGAGGLLCSLSPGRVWGTWAPTSAPGLASAPSHANLARAEGARRHWRGRRAALPVPARPGFPGGLRAGLGTGSERLLGLGGTQGLGRAAVAGLGPCGREARGARLGVAGKFGPGGGRERAPPGPRPGRTVLAGPSGPLSAQDRVRGPLRDVSP